MAIAELRTVAEAAAQMRLSEGAVYDLCRSRQLPHLRLGGGRGAIRINQDDIDRYVAQCFVAGDEQGEGTLEAKPPADVSD